MLGETLKQARLAKQLTQDDIAKRTNLLIQLVDELEHDDFHRIAAPIYGRGFIRHYAEAVGLSSEETAQLIKNFNQMYDGAKVQQVKTREVQKPVAPPKPLTKPEPKPVIVRKEVTPPVEEKPEIPPKVSPPIPVRVKPDFKGPVVAPEEPPEPQEAEENFSSIADYIRRQNQKTSQQETPPAPEQPPAPPKVSKPPLGVVVRHKAKVSLDKIAAAAKNSFEASKGAIAPAKDFFARQGRTFAIGAASLAAIVLLILGISLLFRMTDKTVAFGEGAANFPPPALYAD